MDTARKAVQAVKKAARVVTKDAKKDATKAGKKVARVVTKVVQAVRKARAHVRSLEALNIQKAKLMQAVDVKKANASVAKTSLAANAKASVRVAKLSQHPVVISLKVEIKVTCSI